MDTKIVLCPHCRAKNRVPVDKTETVAKCGRCHKPFNVSEAPRPAEQILSLRCGQCRAKNRVGLSRLHDGAKCGRCGAPLPHEDVLTSQPVLANEANFDRLVLHSPLPVLLYGWAPWCGVCSGTSPMVEELAATTKGKVRVAKLNIDQNPNIAAQYNILSVPAFFIIDAGKVKEHIPGALQRHDLMLKLAPFIA